MTVTFVLGVVFGFLANRRVTFRHRGHGITALRRFLVCYFIVYVLNFMALWILAGQMGIPHAVVQGSAVLVLALLAFIIQKYWVFPPVGIPTEQTESRSPG